MDENNWPFWVRSWGWPSCSAERTSPSWSARWPCGGGWGRGSGAAGRWRPACGSGGGSWGRGRWSDAPCGGRWSESLLPRLGVMIKGFLNWVDSKFQSCKHTSFNSFVRRSIKATSHYTLFRSNTMTNNIENAQNIWILSFWQRN